MARLCGTLTALTLLLAAGPSAAQTPAPETRLFSSSAEIEAMIARAKATIRPDQPNLTQPLLQFAPYRASLEYRQARAPAALHKDDAEYFQVMRGSGDLIEGGELIDPEPGDGPNISAKAIGGGRGRHVAAGDVFMVPPGTPYQFDRIDGALVMIAMRVPMPKAPFEVH